MKLKKVVNVIASVFVVVGFILIISAAGNSDYMSMTGQYYPLSKTMWQMLLGILFFLPKAVLAFVDYFLED